MGPIHFKHTTTAPLFFSPFHHNILAPKQQGYERPQCAREAVCSRSQRPEEHVTSVGGGWVSGLALFLPVRRSAIITVTSCYFWMRARGGQVCPDIEHRMWNWSLESEEEVRWRAELKVKHNIKYYLKFLEIMTKWIGVINLLLSSGQCDLRAVHS